MPVRLVNIDRSTPIFLPPDLRDWAVGASLAEAMHHRIRSSVGQRLYRLRKQTVEPVFGIIKEVLGFRRFLLRGWEKVSVEWTLVSVAWNLKRLAALGMGAKLAARG